MWRPGVRIPYAPPGHRTRLGCSSSGQDTRFSPEQQEFDPPTPHQTNRGRLAQLDRAPLLQRGCSGFESLAVYQRTELLFSLLQLTLEASIEEKRYYGSE